MITLVRKNGHQRDIKGRITELSSNEIYIPIHQKHPIKYEKIQPQ